MKLNKMGFMRKSVIKICESLRSLCSAWSELFSKRTFLTNVLDSN